MGHGCTGERVEYLDYISKIDISHDAPHRQRQRYESTIYMRSVDSNKQAGPLCQGPDYKSSANALGSIQRAQGKGVPHVTMHLRTRQNNTLDPAAQQHLEWLSFSWKTYFSSSTSSTWTESPTWWSSSSWDHRWQLWHSQGWQDKEWWDPRQQRQSQSHAQTCTKRLVRGGQSEKVSIFCQVHLNLGSICSLAHFSDFLFFLAVSRPDSGNCHERDGECTDNTSRALFLAAHARTIDVITFLA